MRTLRGPVSRVPGAEIHLLGKEKQDTGMLRRMEAHSHAAPAAGYHAGTIINEIQVN
jgi:hypothetical protein